MRGKRGCGFTLLELLVVILIIAVLSAVVLPLLAHAREQARRTACARNLSSLAKALYMYCDVPASGMWPTCSTTSEPFDWLADKNPMHALNLLYKAYVQDPRVFSCPSRPVPLAELRKMTQYSAGDSWTHRQWMTPAQCSYGYDPGHSPNDQRAAIMADKKGAGKNSDNHGSNAGQNVLLADGSVEFRETPVNLLLPNAAGQPQQDDDIFGLNPAIPRNLDGYIRQ